MRPAGSAIVPVVVRVVVVFLALALALATSACTHEPAAHADCLGTDDCRPKMAVAALDGTPIGAPQGGPTATADWSSGPRSSSASG